MDDASRSTSCAESTDIVVIGAGPAGIAAASQLSRLRGLRVLLLEAGRGHTRRPCPVDRQRHCTGCGGICNVISGFGGSIHYGDAVKLSGFPAGRRLAELLGADRAAQLVEDALDLFCGQDRPEFRGVESDTGPFAVKDYPVAVVGSVRVSEMIQRLWTRLERAANVEIRLGVRVEGIESMADGFRITTRSGRDTDAATIDGRRVVVAVGRRGQRWWRQTADRLQLERTRPVPSVGVRFECPPDLLAGGAAVHADFKTTVVTGSVKVKTFCFCAGPGGGRIKFTDYGDYTLLDGHVSAEGAATAANFALLAQLRDTAGRARTQEWIDDRLLGAYKRLRTDRPGKPVLQWFPDFLAGVLTCASMDDFRRRAMFTPSVSDYQLADLASVLPADVHSAFCSVFLRLMDYFTDGAFDPARDGARIGVIGLELESLWDEIALTPGMQTTLPGLYACGDCAGLAQGILQAAVSGLAAATQIADDLTAAGPPGRRTFPGPRPEAPPLLISGTGP